MTFEERFSAKNRDIGEAANALLQEVPLEERFEIWTIRKSGSLKRGFLVIREDWLYFLHLKKGAEKGGEKASLLADVNKLHAAIAQDYVHWSQLGLASVKSNPLNSM